MGIPSEMRDVWVNKRKSLLIASPAEEQRIRNAKQCTQEGVRAGAKAAAVACVATAVPTLVAVRVVPWAKANLNYTAQALIISAVFIGRYFDGKLIVPVLLPISSARSKVNPFHFGKLTSTSYADSTASIAAYFITADKTILECARRNSLAQYDKTT
ncbi:Early nodulin 93 ENOD93 protein [Macleaya cordata]|uniref:Early nodulin 93 ENOD93 protein n=1 Tax=Macleaya cordata TaxID=56857 RepID=A0A200QPT1_MACCD|nr:Early nodulin 93 ENOD93 protein [Macleaya cordata]